MEYRRLGRTGLDVSALCLGTMTWGEQNTEAEGHAQMDMALDRGITFFDTAELYPIPPKAETQGRTEEIIGTWFKARGTRDRVILATKVIGRSGNTWFRDDGSTCELNRRQIEEAVDKSLRRLRTDYIDLYQLHWPDRAVSQFGSNPVIFRPTQGPENPIPETLEVLGDLVKAGKIRHVGISNESPWGLMTFLHAAESRNLPRVQSIQNAYSLVNRVFEAGLAEIALREDVGLLAYSPLGQGSLTGKYQGGALPKGSRKQLFDRLQRYETPGAAPAIDAYVALAREIGLDPAQMALAFVTSRSFVTANIIGATTLDQLKIAIDSIDLRITPELEERIDAIHLRHTNPCP
ncbi:aldo/keto reductase [Salinarimonas soli]|uniref:Aldo/keto reductase n=1 Tax=Salinarimonas soli TaxID=1638099 RepID=A0A5B2VFA2_9HYPH|nr:aldo/keto reductase [Salinarimonas soli]KAA2237120.1 aldo/keto reductase [Salinarimonas soli]